MAIYSPRANPDAEQFPRPPLHWPGDRREHLRKIAEAVRLVMDGKINSTGIVTLAANATQTTLTDRRIGAKTKVRLVPTTANAAAALATTFQTFPNTEKWKAVLNHDSNSQVDRTFAFVLLG